MNVFVIVMYIAGCIGIVLSLLIAVKRVGTVRSTAILVSIWSGIVLVTFNAGHMSVLAALVQIALLYTLLLVHATGSIKKDAPLLRIEDSQDTIEFVQATLAPSVDDEARQLEQAEHLQQLKRIIENYFTSNLPFRKQGYSIGNLALETGIPVYQLSAAINQEFGMNFNEFINSYRVTYLTNILQDSFDLQSYTLEALGKMAGFNSRTTFIAAIKKHTGMTPSSFFKNKKNRSRKTVEKQEAFLLKEVA